MGEHQPGATKVTGFAFLKEITNDASSLLIGYCDEGGFPITTNGGNLGLAWDSVGFAVLNNSGASGKHDDRRTDPMPRRRDHCRSNDAEHGEH